MVEYLTIIQARITSNRLPAKVMLDLGGKTLLERVIESAAVSHKSTKVIVATSNDSTDDIIEEKMTALGIDVYRGSLSNVLKRFYEASCKYEANNIIRLTADNPFNGCLIDHLIEIFEQDNDIDYAMFSNGIYGLSPEIMSYKALKKAYENATDLSDQEHITPYIKREFKTNLSDIGEAYKFPNIRATIDVLDDYVLMQKFFLSCNKNGKKPTILGYIDYYKRGLNVN